MPGEAGDVAAAAAGYDVRMVRTGLADRQDAQESSERGDGRPWRHLPRLSPQALPLIPGVVALAANGYELARPSLWRDEAYTIDAAHRSLGQIFAMLPHTDAANGTYYILMRPVVALLGTSAAAIRFPSVVAMAVAAVATAAIGRRLARAAALPVPTVTGLLAGMLLVALPQATRYAQEARSYALVTMFATVATYLLLRALEAGGRRWWAGYGLAIAAMGALNMLSLLLLAAHALSLLISWARARGRGAADVATAEPGRPQPAALRAWLAAAAGAVVVLSPLVVLGMSQSRQISWLKPPGVSATYHFVASFAGSQTLLPLVAVLALAGVGASVANRRSILDIGIVAAPWLIVPPAVLIAVSQVHPLFDSRYVVFCLPALALLVAAGLAWLTQLVMATGLAKRHGQAVAWAPAVALIAVFGVLVAGPQQGVRQPGSRPDNLRRASALVAAHERPGDAVLYVPANKRVVSMGYPAPFRRLWDIALAKSPVAAENLLGTEVPVPVLQHRFAHVTRVWVVSGGLHMLAAPKSPRDQAKMALLSQFHLIDQWRAGLIWLSLYARG